MRNKLPKVRTDDPKRSIKYPMLLNDVYSSCVLGKIRRDESIRRRLRDGQISKKHPYCIDIMGVIGEKSFADMARSRYGWHVNRFRARGDVLGYEVKTNNDPYYGHLKVIPTQRNNRGFVSIALLMDDWEFDWEILKSNSLCDRLDFFDQVHEINCFCMGWIRYEEVFSYPICNVGPKLGPRKYVNGILQVQRTNGYEGIRYWVPYEYLRSPYSIEELSHYEEPKPFIKPEQLGFNFEQGEHNGESILGRKLNPTR